MRVKTRLLAVVLAVVSIFALTGISVADTAKLTAPIYPGAVPAIPAEGTQAAAFYSAAFGGVKTLDCQGTRSSTDFGGRTLSTEEAEQAWRNAGPWCFLSRDPIDKVKAFYDKSIGTMQPIQGENGVHGFEIFAERAWGEGDESRGFYYTGVSVHALPPPPVKSKKPAPGHEQRRQLGRAGGLQIFRTIQTPRPVHEQRRLVRR